MDRFPIDRCVGYDTYTFAQKTVSKNSMYGHFLERSFQLI